MNSLAASDIVALYKPSKCERRIILSAKGIAGTPPGPFDLLIMRMGQEYEQRHLGTIGQYLDLSDGEPAERVQKTRKAIERRDWPVYHGFFEIDLDGSNGAIHVVGEPDLILFDGDTTVIRDVKLARETDTHPEIEQQLQIYAWLIRKTIGDHPIRLEVFNGAGTVEAVALRMMPEAEEILRALAALKETRDLPYEPVGWSKCQGCEYRQRCWTEAEKGQDVALVYGVDGNLAKTLHATGIESISDLVSRHTPESLADVQKPHGKTIQKVGKRAAAILASAHALSERTEIFLARPTIPAGETFVMFDLEGIPPYTDDLGKIYLWGTQVFGTQRGEYLPALAGFGRNGDYEGWEHFLENAQNIFREYGDIPFVHWHHYERDQINKYIDRYGDPNGTAERVKNSLLDLLPIARKSVTLPLSSYSLKEVEKHVGFRRTQSEFGGDWSIAKYIEAVETEDATLRDRVMQEIVTYNREDLEATWDVFQWLRQRDERCGLQL